MRILHEIGQLEKGGAERVIEGIILHDRANEHTVYTYRDGPMRKVFEAAGADVVVDNPQEEHALETNLIHIHTGGQESRLAIAVGGKIPIIETIHSPIVSAVRDDLVVARVGVSGQVTNMNRNCRTIYNGINIDRLNTEGPEFAIKSKMVYPEGDEKKIFFPCREYLEIPPDAFVIGRLGRIGFDKCMEEFLVTCKHVQDLDYGKEVHILIVGDESKDSRGHLAICKVIAASLPLKNVHFLPSIEQVGWAYEAMDLFLYPSPGEGFGLVIAEAMACGVCVLTWDSALNRELFMGCAMLAKPTVESLQNHAVYLMMHEAVRISTAAAGSKLITGDFTSEIMSEKYQDLYLEINPKEEPKKCQSMTENSP